MLQINFIRENPEEVINRLKTKNFDASTLVGQIIGIDEKRRLSQTKLDDSLAEANKIAKLWPAFQRRQTRRSRIAENTYRRA